MVDVTPSCFLGAHTVPAQGALGVLWTRPCPRSGVDDPEVLLAAAMRSAELRLWLQTSGAKRHLHSKALVRPVGRCAQESLIFSLFALVVAASQRSLGLQGRPAEFWKTVNSGIVFWICEFQCVSKLSFAQPPGLSSLAFILNSPSGKWISSCTTAATTWAKLYLCSQSPRC